MSEPIARDAGAQLPIGRRSIAFEVWIVLALSLGASALFSLLDLIRSLTSGASLHAQSAVISAPVLAGRSILELAYQLAQIAVGLAPVALALYLVNRSGESPAAIGIDARDPRKELGWGAGLAIVVGGVGLGFYLAAYHAGINVRVVPTTLPAVWWRIPVLVLAAFQDGALEEVIVCGYLLHRLRQLEWSDGRALIASAVLRGAYHFYQGFGGFMANAVLGLLFGRMYQKNGRLVRLVVAHGLIDTGAFVGYVLLKGHVSWLP